MANQNNRRPDPIGDQQEALNAAMRRAVASVKVPASFDAFNSATLTGEAVPLDPGVTIPVEAEDGGGLQGASGAADESGGSNEMTDREERLAEAVRSGRWEDATKRAPESDGQADGPSSPAGFVDLRTARITEETAGFVRRDDEGLQAPGGDEELLDGTRNASSDQEQRANKGTLESLEGRIPGDRADDGLFDDGTGASGNPFDVVNPAMARMASELTNLFSDEAAAQGAGTAAGRQRPDSSAGGGGVGSPGSGGGSGGGDATVGSAGGTSATNPFTGQGMGVNAYGTPGIPGVGAPGSALNDPLFDLFGSRIAEGGSRVSVFPSVTDGTTGGGGGDTTEGDSIHDQTTQEQTDATDDIVSQSPVHHDGNTIPSGPPEDMTDEALSAAASLLSRLGPAGQVAAAGVKGWQIGREIDETTGIGEAAVGLALSKTEAGKYEAEQEAAAAAAQAKRKEDEARKKEEEDARKKEEEEAARKKKAEEEARKKAEEEAEKKKKEEEAKNDTKDQPGPDGETGGPPTEREMAFRAYLQQMTNYHGSPGHNEGDSTPTEDQAEIPTGTFSITESRDTARALFGQPAEDGSGRRGGPAVVGNRPGDLGNIDYGPDSTGAHTTEQRTEHESEAFDSAPTLSIADARRDAQDDEDDEDDQDS